MTPQLEIDVQITGEINSSPLRGAVQMTLDTASGVINAELSVEKSPKDFAVIAASGQSWVCNSNSGGGARLSSSAQNLLALSDFSYDLSRRNEFPDGSAIDMKFEVRRESEVKVQVKGEWRGTYGLSTNIVGMRAPIIEEMSPSGPGRIRSNYTYEIIDSDGNVYSVNTPSEYHFKPISLSALSIPQEQKRLMFFGIKELERNTRYKMISQSTIITAAEVGLTTMSAPGAGVFVRF